MNYYISSAQNGRPSPSHPDSVSVTLVLPRWYAGLGGFRGTMGLVKRSHRCDDKDLYIDACSWTASLSRWKNNTGTSLDASSKMAISNLFSKPTFMKKVHF